MTVSEFRARKGAGDALVCVTAYDAPFARLAERARVDALLVGDSVVDIVLDDGRAIAPDRPDDVGDR